MCPDIFKSVGDVPYEWLIETDELNWGDNVGGGAAALPIPTELQPAAVSRPCSQPGSPMSRFEAVMKSAHGQMPRTAPCFRWNIVCGRAALRGGQVWVEDVGRWFPGPDGTPVRAHGVIRVINERHAQEEHLAYLSQFDALTGEVNRWRLTAVLTQTLDETVKLQQSCGFPADLDRQSRAHK